MLTIALVFLILADLYFVLTTLVDFAPLNNIRSSTRRERITEVAINGPIMLVPVILIVFAGAFRLPVLAVAAGALELLVAIGGLLLWWLPYLVGVSVPWATAGTGDSWPELHARTYAATIIVLPRIGDRPRPNLEHMILHALVLAGAVFSFIAAGTL
jgi:hypothetical protein